MVNLNQPENINKNNILYRCGWSPLEGFTVPASITHTFVSGHLAYQNGVFNESQKGQRLQFDRG
jgi:dihydroorotase